MENERAVHPAKCQSEIATKRSLSSLVLVIIHGVPNCRNSFFLPVQSCAQRSRLQRVHGNVCTLSLSDAFSAAGKGSVVTAERLGGGAVSAATVALRAPSAAVCTKNCWTKLWAFIMASEYHARISSNQLDGVPMPS